MEQRTHLFLNEFIRAVELYPIVRVYGAFVARQNRHCLNKHTWQQVYACILFFN